jgi:hypothetical protein
VLELALRRIHIKVMNDSPAPHHCAKVHVFSPCPFRLAALDTDGDRALPVRGPGAPPG